MCLNRTGGQADTFESERAEMVCGGRNDPAGDGPGLVAQASQGNCETLAAKAGVPQPAIGILFDLTFCANGRNNHDMLPCLIRICGFPVAQLAVVSLFVLTWSNPAFSDEIHDAARDGDLEKVKALLEDNPDLVNSKDAEWSTTALHDAAENGRRDVVEFLLAHGADVNAIAVSKQTPLHLAALNGHLDVVELLVASNADINTLGNINQTPLSLAAQNGHKDVVEFLLAHGADVDVNIEDYFGDTPLHHAAQDGYQDVVELLLAHGAVYKNVLDAAAAGDLEKVRALVKQNADLISSKDRYKRTPLHYAANNGQKDMVEFLLAQGADINATDVFGQRPLSMAMRKNYKDVVDVLSANNAKDGVGNTPLHYAAKNGTKNTVELLLTKKADVNARNDMGETPLHLAAVMGHKDMVELLVANKADYDIFDAAAIGDLETVKTMLKEHPDLVFSKDNSGYTPLHYAAQDGHFDAAELLLANNAEVNATNNYGWTPLNFAVMLGHTNVADLLRQHGGTNVLTKPWLWH